MKKILFIIMVFLLTGFSTTEHKEIKQYVSAWMEYPPSSINFKDIYVSREGRVCGFVNAKDKNGSDIGYSPFLYIPAFKMVFFDTKYKTKSTTNPKYTDFSGLWLMCQQEKHKKTLETK